MIHNVSHLINFRARKFRCDFSRFLHGHHGILVIIFASIIILSIAILRQTCHGIVVMISRI